MVLELSKETLFIWSWSKYCQLVAPKVWHKAEFLRKRSQTCRETGKNEVFFAVCGMLHAACLPLHLDAFFWPHCHLLSSFSKRNNYNKLLLGLQEKRWVLCWGVTDDYFQLRTCSWTVVSQHIWNILFRGKKRVEGCGFSKCLHLFPVFLSAMWTFPLFTLLLTSWSGWVSLWPAVCKAVEHQASVSGCCFIWQGLVRKCSLV